MRHAYDDEDNAPMFEELPLPYPIRTWEDFIKEESNGKQESSVRSPALYGLAGPENADPIRKEREDP